MTLRIASLRIAALTFRIQRFEMILVLGATILSVLVSALVISWIRTAGYDRCMTDENLSLTGFCHSAVGDWLFRIARLSGSIVPVFPIVAGLLIGGPVVARELESGTARLAWSLSPSRLRWFVHRAVPALLLAVVAGVAIGLTADAILHVSEPSLDIDQSFAGFRQRGLLIGVQALLIAAIALAIGSILGRAIPTFVLALILFGGIGIAVDKVESQLLTNEALTTDSFQWNDAAMFLESRIRMPDGQVLTWQQMSEIHPDILNNGYDPEVYRDVVLYIPGSRYHEIEGREALALTTIAGLFVLVAGMTVVRRRPR
ncbi:MAG: hypothetical protein H0V73_06480 [Chloroflexi bacterium]|nr:hypothetical protein [Chloroflexota bacterium]